MLNPMKPRIALLLLALVSAGSLVASGAFAQTTPPSPAPKQPPSAAAPAQKPQGTVAPTTTGSHFHPAMAGRARKYYALVWGVNDLKVTPMESGELIRFNYRVLDPAKAGPLNDKKIEPFLVDETAGVKLTIPSLEKVGQLRQSATPEAGKIYWMAFSNKGGYVKSGHQVSVVIGDFHATGLVVE